MRTEGDDYALNDDHCYECTGYGDDYSINENGDLERNCDGCIYNQMGDED